MRYIFILLLFVACDSDFYYPNECESHNDLVERKGRIMLQELNIRCADDGCTDEEYQQGLDEIDEYLDNAKCTEDECRV